MLIPKEQERCFCVGTPGVAADAGSPVAAHCPHFKPGLGNTTCTLPPSPPGWLPAAGSASASAGAGGAPGLLRECEESGIAGERCMQHTMGFGGMVEPLSRFVLRTI